MPRRFGDLEIVEAVPRRTLLTATVLLGILLGTLLSLGTGDWWRHVVMGVITTVFRRPPIQPTWVTTPATTSASYRARRAAKPHADSGRGRPRHSWRLLYGVDRIVAHSAAACFARATMPASHLGALLACLALVIAWGAVLDPAETVGGPARGRGSGSPHRAQTGAAVVAAVAILTVVISLVWAWRDRPTLILAGWAALFVTIATGYFRDSGRRSASTSGPESAELVRHAGRSSGSRSDSSTWIRACRRHSPRGRRPSGRSRSWNPRPGRGGARCARERGSPAPAAPGRSRSGLAGRSHETPRVRYASRRRPTAALR